MGVVVREVSSDPGYALLRHLLENHEGTFEHTGGLGVTPIVAGWLRMDSKQAARLLAELEAEGWLGRSTNGRRLHRIWLTDEAKAGVPNARKVDRQRVEKEYPIYLPPPVPTVESLTDELRVANAEIKAWERVVQERDEEIARLQRQLEEMNLAKVANGRRPSWAPRETVSARS